MHEADGQRPKKLVEAQLLERPLKDISRSLIGLDADRGIQMHVDLRAVSVNMFMGDAIVLMEMRMDESAIRVAWGVAMRDALRNAGQVQDAEQDQHQADGQLHGETDARRNDDVEQDNDGADAEDSNGVARPRERR